VQRIIPFDTPSEVRAEVRHLIDPWQRPQGRLMLAAGNMIHRDCGLESLAALFDESYSYGAWRPAHRASGAAEPRLY
jgi:hypothetical protein